MLIYKRSCMTFVGFNKKNYKGCLKIREFRIKSVVRKDPVELEKYLRYYFPQSSTP
jgi:hypothetical protein